MIEFFSELGGIYVAAFGIAVVSGVFPLVSSELFLVGIAMSNAGTPKLLVIAGLIALGQTVSHSTLFQAARGVTSLGEKRRAKFEKRIERARAVVSRWRGNVPILLCSAATLGLPPMMLVSVAAGALRVRFRTFVIIGVLGRVLRFATIAVVARCF